MKTRALAATLALVAALPASAQEELLTWIAGTVPEAPMLLYGIPDSDHIVIGFRCAADLEGIQVTYNHEPLMARPGMTIAIDLSSAGGAYLVPATAIFSEMMGAYFLEGMAKAEALEPILSAGDMLFVMVEDGVEELPQAAPEMVRDFFASCARVT